MFPHLASLVPFSFEALAPEAIAVRAEAVFFALPHTKSFGSVAACLAAGKPVVDLSADYRLKNPRSYETWYQTAHPYPKLLEEAVYGLPELNRAKIRTARLVASPGCYPTAAILQLAPLVAKGLVHQDAIIIDAKSGISGAGRSPALPYHFPEAHESVEAYKIGQHRHIPEIEQEANQILARMSDNGMRVTFRTQRDTKTAGVAETLEIDISDQWGTRKYEMFSTAYCRLQTTVGVEELRAIYRDYYKGERFVRLQEGDISANPRHVRGSNFCDLAVFANARAGWVITVAALDNLVKGAAGQALQAMNLMLGFPEEMGLTAPGAYP